MDNLQAGVIGTSKKENEKRVPIHPAHLARIDKKWRDLLIFETGYGARFGISDAELSRQVGGLASRHELLTESDVVILPKALQSDFEAMKPGSVFWGWAHLVQQQGITQAAIDRKLTVITWESMHRWRSGDYREMHIFYKNNEMAGYCAVLHALQLMGMDGFYGRDKKVAILSHGSVSRGAAYALMARGFCDITFYTQRPPHLVHDQIPGCRYLQMLRGRTGATPMFFQPETGIRLPMFDAFAAADVIVNGILQDPDDPVVYITEHDINRLKPGSIIIDVSCDTGMGFPFALPTTFDEPIFQVGKVFYYGVDHTPSYLWDSASWEISASLISYLPIVLAGPGKWEQEDTISRAIELRDGVIRNPNILSFQKREDAYPHRIQK